MSDDLVTRLRRIGERVKVPCPDEIKGCLVFHYRIETDPTCAEAADEIERLREALRYYAENHYPNVNDGPWGVNSTDFGDVARAALANKGEKP